MGMEGRNFWALNSAWRLSLRPPASLASPCCSDWHPINTQIIDRNSLGLDFILASEGTNPGAADSSLLTICLNAHEPQYRVLLKPPWSKAYNWYTSFSAYLSSSVKQRQQKYFPLPVLICKTIEIEINDRINNMMLSSQKFSEIGSAGAMDQQTITCWIVNTSHWWADAHRSNYTEVKGTHSFCLFWGRGSQCILYYYWRYCNIIDGRCQVSPKELWDFGKNNEVFHGR